jgi:hypothetical protein
MVIASFFALICMHQAWGHRQIRDDKESLKGECYRCIRKAENNYPSPTPSCCHTVRTINMIHVCDTITPEEEHELDVRKIVFIGMACNNPVPVGHKCGSV